MTRFAFLFDLDGTLIDSRRTIAVACNEALVKVGRAPLPEAEIATYVGAGARNLVARALREDPTSPAVDAMLAEYVAFYAAHPTLGTTWMPGAREALDRVAGARVGLVTNKARAMTIPVLRALGIEARFGVVVAGGDAALKPDPEPIVMAMAALGASPRETWIVGDGTQDVRGGKAAGCRTAAVLGGFHPEARLRAEAPDVVLGSLFEIGALLGDA